MAFAVAAMTAASLGGSLLTNRAGRKAAEQSQAQSAADKATALQLGKAAGDQYLPGYQNAQNVRQQVMDQNLGLAGQTFQPTMDVMQQGGMMNQEAILAGLGLHRNAILGKEMDYSALQAGGPQMDMSALSGLTNPETLQFTEFKAPDSGVMGFTAGDAGDYLEAFPDIKADYLAKRSELLEGDPENPNYRTLEAYGRWHYDNFGKAEIAAGKRLPIAEALKQRRAKGVVKAAPITTAQVAKAIGGETP